nr:unnamed protein product [Spirometra erinaceieuropaei]
MVSEEVFTFPEPADDALQHPSTSPRSPPAFDRHPGSRSQDRHQASPGHSLPMDKSEKMVMPKNSEESPPMLIDLSQGDSSTSHHSLQTTAKLPRPPSVELLATTPSSTQTMTTDLFADFNGFAADTPAPAKTYPNVGSSIFSSPTPLTAAKPAVSSVVDADFGEFTSAKFDATASTAQSTSSVASQPFVNFDFSPQPQNTISLHSDGQLAPSPVTPLATPTSIPKTVPPTSGASKAEKPSLGKLWQDFDSMSIDLDLRHKSAPTKPSAPSLRQLQNQKMTNSLQTSSTARLPQAPIVAEMSGKSSKLATYL